MIVLIPYSRTSMARTSLRPWKFVRDMGSSSHWGLIMAPAQKANSDNLGNFSIFYTMIVCWVYSLESPRWGDSNEYTQHTWRNKKKSVNICFVWAIGRMLWGLKKVRIIHGKRAIRVRAIEVIQYIDLLNLSWIIKCLFLMTMEL